MRAASGQGKVAWEWILEVERAGVTFEYLATPGKGFVSLDDKLSAAISLILTGDIGQDIYNQAEAMKK